MNVKIRGFEEVSGRHCNHSSITILPKRGTNKAAGYDFRIKEKIEIRPNETVVTMSDVKAYMQNDEVLKLYIRSSVGIKDGVRISNGTGIIDADYYSNPKNDGNIGIALHNYGKDIAYFNVGDRVCQGIFMNYLKADNDDVDSIRVGGTGSTGK